MNDPAIRALERLIELTDGGRRAVANAIHANEQTLYQILAGVPLKSGKERGIGRDLRDRLTRAYPDWLTLSTPPSAAESRASYNNFVKAPAPSAMAHPLSPHQFDTPPTIKWEDVVKLDELPADFVLEVPDSAIAPKHQAGTKIVFSSSAEPKTGKAVLVRDRNDEYFVRIYGNVRADRWQAIALDVAHVTLDSHDDGLVLKAVALWVEA